MWESIILKIFLFSFILILIILSVDVLYEQDFKPMDNPNNNDSVRNLTITRLKIEEGFRKHAYQDSVGVWTIGYGTNLEIGLYKNEAEFLLSNRLNISQNDLIKFWSEFLNMPKDVQVGLLDLNYQLGIEKLLKFDTMLGLLKERKFADAADDLLLTKEHRETPKRSNSIANLFRLAN